MEVSKGREHVAQNEGRLRLRENSIIGLHPLLQIAALPPNTKPSVTFLRLIRHYFHAPLGLSPPVCFIGTLHKKENGQRTLKTQGRSRFQAQQQQDLSYRPEDCVCE